ncbi:MAG: HAMP domain-containing sensor histidine kinase [Campylobacterales bacterium]|nr:HAMP domain-containing sensor histidine kinase [Campylobacterales bacterium]
MIQYSFIAYECINAIGNSLELNVMLTEVVSTFIRCMDAIGGRYVQIFPEAKCIVSIGKDFEIPQKLSGDSDGFEIHFNNNCYILDFPIGDGHFLFYFNHNNDLQLHGTMLSNFRTKLTNAIDACQSVEQLHNLNLTLTDQVVEEKNKNAITEKLMITQSRMAIMGEMIGMIAHQWRQPITIIGMVSNNALMDIQMGNLNTVQLSEDLDLIDKQVHYLSQTIDDFRNFFRPNKLPQKVTLHELYQELIIIFGKNFESNKITLVFEGDLFTPIVTYKNELLQVFLNMLSNSKDAFVETHKKEGKITITSSISDCIMTITINDNGGGIPPSIIEHIFEPYFSTKSKQHGTGLGLYMSAIIVEKHLEGNILVHSDTEETTFTVRLPLQLTQEAYNVY